eukprot:Rmarinus@m.14736
MQDSAPEEVYDRYGFIIKPSMMAKFHEHNSSYWSDQGCKNRHHDKITSVDSLYDVRATCFKGLSPEIRASVWYMGSAASAKQEAFPDYYANFLEKAKSSDMEYLVSARKQIDKDIPRTFPNHRYFRVVRSADDSDSGGDVGAVGRSGAPREDGLQESLRNVLLAYAAHNPSVGYCQAMNFIVGLMLLAFHAENNWEYITSSNDDDAASALQRQHLLEVEQKAFWMLRVVAERLLPGYFTQEMDGSIEDQRIFAALVHKYLPSLEPAKDGLNVIACAWFLRCFAGDFPTETTFRMWDCFFLRGPFVLFRCALAFLARHEAELLPATDDLAMFMMTITTLQETEFDCDSLLTHAYSQAFEDIDHTIQQLKDEETTAEPEPLSGDNTHGGRNWSSHSSGSTTSSHGRDARAASGGSSGSLVSTLRKWMSSSDSNQKRESIRTNVRSMRRTSRRLSSLDIGHLRTHMSRNSSLATFYEDSEGPDSPRTPRSSLETAEGFVRRYKELRENARRAVPGGAGANPAKKRAESYVSSMSIGDLSICSNYFDASVTSIPEDDVPEAEGGGPSAQPPHTIPEHPEKATASNLSGGRRGDAESGSMDAVDGTEDSECGGFGDAGEAGEDKAELSDVTARNHCLENDHENALTHLGQHDGAEVPPLPMSPSERRKWEVLKTGNQDPLGMSTGSSGSLTSMSGTTRTVLQRMGKSEAAIDEEEESCGFLPEDTIRILYPLASVHFADGSLDPAVLLCALGMFSPIPAEEKIFWFCRALGNSSDAGPSEVTTVIDGATAGDGYVSWRKFRDAYAKCCGYLLQPFDTETDHVSADLTIDRVLEDARAERCLEYIRSPDFEPSAVQRVVWNVQFEFHPVLATFRAVQVSVEEISRVISILREPLK